MVIIVIRRFVRPDRVDEFIAAYQKQSPINDPAFRGETLARGSERNSLPPALRRLVADETAGVNIYLQVSAHFPSKLYSHDPAA